MQDFADKVAVITGAASGIGYAIAEHSAQRGMKVVLADIEAPALAAAADKLRAQGATVLPVVTDVSQAAAVETLAQTVYDTFGATHLLVNNAGIGSVSTGAVLTGTLANWQWVMGVNLWGVIHGVHVFAPLMLQQNTPAAIVNVASMAGLISGRLGIYTVTKHAIVALSETLYEELTHLDTPLQAHVLCPSTVNTGIVTGERNRPAAVPVNPDESAVEIPGRAERMERHREAIAAGADPASIATAVFDAIINNRFYIIPHTNRDHLIQIRMDDILQRRNPNHSADLD
jgi:NAD(P)-dependent dehydrogenase (short-subunit alcohol dehydrogenase family)